MMPDDVAPVPGDVPSVPGSLLPHNGEVLAGCLDLLGLLHESAEMAAQDHQQVLANPARYLRSRADFPAHFEQRKDVDQRYKVEQAVEEAGFSDSLGVLAERVARNEVGDDAETHVVETTADAVSPGHGDWLEWKGGW